MPRVQNITIRFWLEHNYNCDSHMICSWLTIIIPSLCFYVWQLYIICTTDLIHWSNHYNNSLWHLVYLLESIAARLLMIELINWAVSILQENCSIAMHGMSLFHSASSNSASLTVTSVYYNGKLILPDSDSWMTSMYYEVDMAIIDMSSICM